MPQYKCPNCNGEFDHWDGGVYGVRKCPFCGKRRGEYDSTAFASPE